MIKETEVKITGHRTNFNYYKELGYDIKYKKSILVKVEDLMPGSTFKITAICDKCGVESFPEYRFYFQYTKSLTEEYYCNKCNKSKARQTCLNKYGVDNPMKSKIIKDRLKNSLISTYGVDHYSRTGEYKEKYKSTCFHRYGLTNTFQVDEFKIKSRNTSMEKYGVEYFINLQSARKKSKLKKENKTKEIYESTLNENFSVIEYESDTFLIHHNKCGQDFSIGKKLFYSRNVQNVCICTICNPIGSQSSYMESEIREILDRNGINYLKKDRSILNGKELDILIPNKNIAIEINGVYWHNELYKDKNYHIDKTKLCQENRIQLLHIWEDDWKYKRNIVESIILNKLNIIPNKVYARKCEISLVHTKDATKFLNENHIQGTSSSSLKLGLFYDKELISLMTFGYRYTNGKKEYELIRFCNKINISVIGSASKLFKYFLRNYNIDRIISYSDISLFDGGMYEKLGFREISLSEPNYFWVVDEIRKHRFNYNKKKLVSQGFDPNLTEVEIMHGRGYYRVWGCGQKRWEYSNH